MANNKRLSFSRYKRLLFGCEAAAVYSKFKQTEATATGQLVERITTGEDYEDFVEENKEFFLKKNGDHKKCYERAVGIALNLRQDPSFRELLKDQQQVRVEFTIDGIPWLGFADFVNSDIITDLKVVKSVNKDDWCDLRHAKVPFYIKNEYAFQGAIYTRGLGIPRFQLYAVTKEAITARKIVQFPQEVLDSAWEHILLNQHHAWALINGEIEPRRCEVCDYCVSTQEKPVVEKAYDFIINPEVVEEVLYAGIHN